MKDYYSWRRNVMAICFGIGILATLAGLVFYYNSYPPDFYCRSEFKRATGIELPTDGKLVASCSASFYSTAAVYEINSQHWHKFLESLSRVGKPGILVPDEECDPSIRSVLIGPVDTLVRVMANRDQLIWSTSSATRRIYWQVTVD